MSQNHKVLNPNPATPARSLRTTLCLLDGRAALQDRKAGKGKEGARGCREAGRGQAEC